MAVSGNKRLGSALVKSLTGIDVDAASKKRCLS